MRKIFYILLLIPIVLSVICLVPCARDREQYIRLHIRANSNSELDQTVKLEVRDAVIEFLVPFARLAKDKEDMLMIMREKIEDIREEADRVLNEKGIAYNTEVYLDREDFPIKTYGDLTLEAGSYDALIINLGTGEGKNWWCVAFPPLCFIPAEDNGTDEVVYKSKIAEWFDKIFD